MAKLKEKSLKKNNDNKIDRVLNLLPNVIKNDEVDLLSTVPKAPKITDFYPNSISGNQPPPPSPPPPPTTTTDNIQRFDQQAAKQVDDQPFLPSFDFETTTPAPPEISKDVNIFPNNLYVQNPSGRSYFTFKF